MKPIYVFVLLLLLLFSCKKEDPSLVVGIQPYGQFSKAKTDTIAKTIAAFYQIKTIILPSKELYKEAFTEVKSPRYRADKIINIQKKNKVDSLDFILGLTSRDISVTKKDKWGRVKTPTYKYADWGIMGLAYCPGNSCIISTFRIQHTDPKTHFTRFKKVAVHEFGHNLGLPHCPNKTCVMTDAVESVKTIDHAKLALCEECKEQLD